MRRSFGQVAASARAAGPVAAQALTARPSLDGTRATGYPHLRGQRWPNFSVTEMVSVVGDDLPKQAVRLAVGPGGEDQLACLGCVPVAEAQAPQTVDDDRAPVLLPQLAETRTGVRVVDVDVTVAEVPDQQVAAELTESGRCQREPPWRVQRATGDQTLDQSAVVGEDIHETVTRPGHVIMQNGILLGVGDVQLAPDFLDTERPVARGQPGIHEQPTGQLH